MGDACSGCETMPLSGKGMATNLVSLSKYARVS
jgi:hypothetical protein